VLPKYHQYLKIFKNINADKLPLHCPSYHQIPLVDGLMLTFSPLYSLSRPELQELKRRLDENVSKGFIHIPSSLATTLLVFVKKGDGLLRLVAHYRGINEGTIKDRYLLALLQDTPMESLKAKWFTKLDI
jgi:hypothetical protein